MADWIGVDVAKATTCGHDAPHEGRGLCKPCYRRAYYEEHRERERADALAWAQANPARVAENLKRWRAANPEAIRQHKRSSYQAHAEEKRAASREWQQANKDKSYARAHQWRLDNPERAAEVARAGSSKRRARRSTGVCDLTAAHWRMLLAQFHHGCFYCGVSGVPLQVEHMTPLSRGGMHTAANIVPACGPCNRRKSTKTAEEFLGLL